MVSASKEGRRLECVVDGMRRLLYDLGVTTRRYKQGCSLLLSHFRGISVGAVKLATRQVPALAETSVEVVFITSAAVAFANFRVLSALWQLVDHKTENGLRIAVEASRRRRKMVYLTPSSIT